MTAFILPSMGVCGMPSTSMLPPSARVPWTRNLATGAAPRKTAVANRGTCMYAPSAASDPFRPNLPAGGFAAFHADTGANRVPAAPPSHPVLPAPRAKAQPVAVGQVRPPTVGTLPHHFGCPGEHVPPAVRIRAQDKHPAMGIALWPCGLAGSFANQTAQRNPSAWSKVGGQRGPHLRTHSKVTWLTRCQGVRRSQKHDQITPGFRWHRRAGQSRFFFRPLSSPHNNHPSTFFAHHAPRSTAWLL